MAFLKSLKNVESKNVKLYIYYSMDHMKYMFKKNEGSNGRHFKFSVNGEILLMYKFIYENGGTGMKIKPLDINLGDRFFKFFDMKLDKTFFTTIRKKFKKI